MLQYLTKARLTVLKLMKPVSEAARTSLDKARPYVQQARRGATVGEPYFFIALSWIVSLSLFYRAPVFPQSGLDPSWQYALAHAYEMGMSFGADFSFTGGPYSFLYTAHFSPDTYFISILAAGIQAAILTAALFYIQQRYLALVTLHLTLLIVANLSGDVYGFLTAFAVFLLAMSSRAPLWLRLSAAAVSGVFGLAKFSFMLCLICLLGLVDTRRLLEARRVPIFLPAFLGGLVVFWLLAGQNPLLLPGFVINSLDVASGYSQALGNFGVNTKVVALYLMLWATSSLLAVYAWPFARDAVSWRRMAYWMGFTGFMFLVVKSAVVREGHDVIAWQMILPIFLLTLFSMKPVNPRRWAVPSFVGVIFMSGLYFATPGVSDGKVLGQWAKERGQLLFARSYYLRSVAQAPAFRRNFSATYHEQVADLGALSLIDTDTTVGSAPWDLSTLIASGQRIVFQPSLQSYTSVTNRLRKRDAAYFGSDRSPEILLMELKAIDNRSATMDFGPGLIEILSHYDFAGENGLAGVLSKRSQPRETRTTDLFREDVQIGAWTPVPEVSDGLIYLQADAQYNLGGVVEGFFLKFEHLWLDIRYDNGTESSYRFIPSMGETGFVLPGAWSSTRDLYDQVIGGFNGPEPVALRLRRMEAPFDDGIHSTVELTWSAFRFDGDAEIAPVLTLTQRLRSGRIEETPATDFVEEGYVLHSPSRVVTAFDPDQEIIGRFGFRNAAIEAGPPAPTVFSVSLRHRRTGETATLFSRRLDVANNVEDRGPQPVSIEPPGIDGRAEDYELVFSIIPENGDNSYGWTYWGDRF